MRADGNQKEIVEALRGIGASVAVTSQVGNGFPDIVVGLFGKNYLMEIKNKDTYGKLSTEQKIFADKWKGKIILIETVDDALRAVGVDI